MWRGVGEVRRTWARPMFESGSASGGWEPGSASGGRERKQETWTHGVSRGRYQGRQETWTPGVLRESERHGLMLSQERARGRDSCH